MRRRVASGEHAPLAHARPSWPFSTPAFVAALELAEDAVVIIDRSGMIQYANGACRALLERTRLEGARLFDLITVESRELRALLRRLRDTPVCRSTMVVDLHTASDAPGGPCRDLAVSVGAVRSERGAIHGFSITARVARDKRLGSARDVFLTLSRVAGEVAHDLNNHVSVVLNYSFILLRQLASDRPERGHVEEMQQAAWRVAETARLLLRFAGKRGAQPVALDVNEVVRDALAVLALISRTPTAIEQRLLREPCFTRARQSQVEWLLLELTQRLSTRLGGLGKLRIATQHAPRGRDTALGARKRIRILLDGYPRKSPRFDELSGTRMLPSDPSVDADAGVRVSEQLGYELALHALPDSGLRYAIELPSD